MPSEKFVSQNVVGSSEVRSFTVTSADLSDLCVGDRHIQDGTVDGFHVSSKLFADSSTIMIDTSGIICLRDGAVTGTYLASSVFANTSGTAVTGDDVTISVSSGTVSLLDDGVTREKLAPALDARFNSPVYTRSFSDLKGLGTASGVPLYIPSSSIDVSAMAVLAAGQEIEVMVASQATDTQNGIYTLVMNGSGPSYVDTATYPDLVSNLVVEFTAFGNLDSSFWRSSYHASGGESHIISNISNGFETFDASAWTNRVLRTTQLNDTVSPMRESDAGGSHGFYAIAYDAPPNDEATVEFWIRVDAEAGVLPTSARVGLDKETSLYINSTIGGSGPYFALFQNPTVPIAIREDDTWYHVVAAFDASSNNRFRTTVWINGASGVAQEYTDSGDHNREPFWYFNASGVDLAAIRVYNDILTQDEVEALYAAGASGVVAPGVVSVQASYRSTHMASGAVLRPQEPFLVQNGTASGFDTSGRFYVQTTSGTVGAVDISFEEYLTGGIANGVVTGFQMSSGAIRGGRLAIDASGVVDIVGNSIDGFYLSSGLVTGDRLAVDGSGILDIVDTLNYSSTLSASGLVAGDAAVNGTLTMTSGTIVAREYNASLFTATGITPSGSDIQIGSTVHLPISRSDFPNKWGNGARMGLLSTVDGWWHGDGKSMVTYSSGDRFLEIGNNADGLYHVELDLDLFFLQPDSFSGARHKFILAVTKINQDDVSGTMTIGDGSNTFYPGVSETVPACAVDFMEFTYYDTNDRHATEVHYADTSGFMKHVHFHVDNKMDLSSAEKIAVQTYYYEEDLSHDFGDYLMHTIALDYLDASHIPTNTMQSVEYLFNSTFDGSAYAFNLVNGLGGGNNLAGNRVNLNYGTLKMTYVGGPRSSFEDNLF